MRQVSSAVVYVAVVKPDGSPDIGTAFHIGGGYCVTARHVVEGNEIVSVGRRDTSRIAQISTTGRPSYTTVHGPMNCTVEGIFKHPDDHVDVSIIKLGGPRASTIQPCLQLSSDADIYTEGQFLMKEVVVFGYPPIPESVDPHLVVFRGEVSAVIQNRTDQKRHFVISGMARGGFSGGPVVSLEPLNLVLGVVARSLMRDTGIEELGFIGAISIQTAFEIIDHHGLRIGEVRRR